MKLIPSKSWERLPWLVLTLSFLSFIFISCSPQVEEQTEEAEAETVSVDTDWEKDANIYEVNIRQYTEEGTINAFAQHLPRLQEMGVEILWFMPIFPISDEKKKGTLGSYYAISDYTEVNPNFGTKEDFQKVVDQAHELGMKVILDWVPNHTGWGHTWLSDHPDWYTQDSLGNVIDPIDPKTGESWGWTDVADLNYDNTEMRTAMRADMMYWLDSVGTDGFRVDVAGEVPLDFWKETLPPLREAHPDIFLLAEAQEPDHRNTPNLFDMSYGWSFHHLMNEIAQGKKEASEIDSMLAKDKEEFKQGYHMQFITNHDENSWNGTIEERMGDAADAMAVLAFTFNGMPLIYSGQEAGMNKRLEFFEKDPIEWGDFSKANLYTTLLKLKKSNEALWNGEWGGALQRLQAENENIYAFYREKGEDKVVVVLNFSDSNQEASINTEAVEGSFNDVFKNEPASLGAETTVNLEPWSYMVLSKEG